MVVYKRLKTIQVVTREICREPFLAAILSFQDEQVEVQKYVSVLQGYTGPLQVAINPIGHGPRGAKLCLCTPGLYRPPSGSD